MNAADLQGESEGRGVMNRTPDDGSSEMRKKEGGGQLRGSVKGGRAERSPSESSEEGKI